MNDVDYLKLCDQYASFLVAIGGVSITVLALVLTITTSRELIKGNLGSFLVLALVAATVCCFIGAHMMTETAAFISYNKELEKEAAAKEAQPPQSAKKASPDETPPAAMLIGKRLFVLASINIFLAVILLLFALMLLPSAFKLFSSGSVQSISFATFLIVTAGALYWMILGAYYRLNVNNSRAVIFSAVLAGLICCLILCFGRRVNKWLLWLTFGPIISFTVFTLFYFTSIFKDGSDTAFRNVYPADFWIFSLTIAVSYAVLVAAASKTMFGRHANRIWRNRRKIKTQYQ